MDNETICVIGLGYVGLPLAVEFARVADTIGFDISAERVEALRQGIDATLEVTPQELADAARLTCTDNPEEISAADIYIVTVPTPVDNFKRPDLAMLEQASRLIGGVISPGNYVIYESTVFPGATEEVCAPIIEKESGLVLNRDFYLGYSPERINPGDKQHRVPSITKVTSGSTPEAARFIDDLYGKIITAGTYAASSIRVAEAAKVIENTQRDLNIALINELAMIFGRLGINTQEVLEAAGTKWNFLPFRPGLVGGHCIGVDPYYLTHKAQELGYHPQVILSGRRINDGMGAYVAGQLVKLMAKKRIPTADARILILGLAFKENCPDLRNTRVIDIVDELNTYHARVDVYDPWVDVQDAERRYRLNMIHVPEEGAYDAIVLAVAHDRFIALGIDTIETWGKPDHVIYDVKSVLPRDRIDGSL